MHYTDLLQLWDQAVQAVDAQDWTGALATLDQITEPTSRTLFTAASAHLALGQFEPAVKSLDLTLAKDERLAVGFFQRSAVMMKLNRLEEALSDCIWAQKHMRGNTVIDYKQLGLRFKLSSWQVLYNAAAVYSRMGHWERAEETLVSVSQERAAGSRTTTIEAALDSIQRGQVLAPLQVPNGVVFRPRKQDVDQLKQRDFLGKPKVISSMIPNDDFGGFEPLRPQKPGFYQPKGEGAQDSCYMRVKSPYMARGPGELTAPGGAIVFLFGKEDRDGMATVIYDGQRGLLPMSLLEYADVKTSKRKKENRIPSGIPLPPELNPPTRPKKQQSAVVPPQGGLTPPPSYVNATHIPLQAAQLPTHTASSSSKQKVDTPRGAEGETTTTVVVKVNYSHTVTLSVPLSTTYKDLKEKIAQKLGQPASQLGLRRKEQGSKLLMPLEGAQRPLREVAEVGRATVWCQRELPLGNRAILYQMLALYDYNAQGAEDLDFSEGDTIDVLNEVNEEWLEGRCGERVGIFPGCFAYRVNANAKRSSLL